MSDARGRVLPYAAVACAAASWGTWSIFLRHAEAMGPMPAALESAVAMGVQTLVSGVTSLRDRVAVPAPWRARAWVAFMGVADAMNVMLFFAAYKLTIGVAILAHYLTPVFVALAAPLLLRERLGRGAIAAVAMSFAGLAVVLAPSVEGASAPVAMRSAALAAGSAVFYATNTLVTKFVASHYSSSETIFLHGLVATPLLAALVPAAAWSATSGHAIAYLAVASLGPGAAAGLAFVWGLRRLPAAHASTLTLLEPLVAVMVGVGVFGEPLRWHTIAGALLVLAGAARVMTRPASTHAQ